MKNKNYFGMVVTMLLFVLGMNFTANAQGTNLMLARTESYQIRSLYINKDSKVSASPYYTASAIGADVYGFKNTSGNPSEGASLLVKNNTVIKDFSPSYISNVITWDDQIIVSLYDTVNSGGFIVNSNFRTGYINPTNGFFTQIPMLNNIKVSYGSKGKNTSLFGLTSLVFKDSAGNISIYNNVDGQPWFFVTQLTNEIGTNVFYFISAGSDYDRYYKFDGNTKTFTLIAKSNPGLASIAYFQNKLYFAGVDQLIVDGVTTPVSDAFSYRMGILDLNTKQVSTMDLSSLGSSVSLMLGDSDNLYIPVSENLYTLSEISGIDDFRHIQIGIYPNPATDIITISGYTKEVFVYATIGTLVANGTDRIDISGLNSGVYFIKNKQGQYLSKFIKQ